MTKTDLDRLNKDRLRLRVVHALVDRMRKFVAGIEPL
jgi:hypothetical protein